MIDWDRVYELRADIGEPDFDEVISLFLTEVEEALSQLDATAPNTATREDAFHFLKGAAINLGFNRFANACHAAETICRRDPSATIDTKSLRHCYEMSKTRFLAGLSGRATLPDIQIKNSAKIASSVMSR